MSRIRFICVIFYLLVLQNTTAQTNELKPLVEVIKVLELRYTIPFSYSDAVLKDVFASIPSEMLPLRAALDNLEAETPIQFIILEQTIAVQKKELNSFTNQSLSEVFIRQYLAKGVNLNKNGSIDIIPKAFDIIPGLTEPDVLESIKSLPGISSTDESIANLNIRGGTNDQNLLLWDGIKMWQSNHFFGMISAFEPYSINTINVSRNGTSARFGDGVSGTLAMSLDKDISTQIEGNAGLNFIYGSGSVKLPLSKKIGVQFTARRSITDVVQSITYQQYFDRVFQDTDITNTEQNNTRTSVTDESFYFYDLNGKLLYNISEKDKLSISLISINNNLTYQENAANPTVNQTRESALTQQNNAGGFHYSRSWNNQFNTHVSGYLSNYKLDGINYDVENDQRLFQFNEVLDMGLRLENNYSFSKQQQVQFGYQFTETGVSNAFNVNTPPINSFIRNVLRNHAAYAQYTFNDQKETLKIETGIRVTNYPSLNKTLREPRLNVSYTFIKPLRGYILGEFKHQATSQIIVRQNDFLGVVKHRWVIANNADIPLLKSKQGSLGFTYNKNKWILNLEGYYKEVEGINSRSQGFLNQFQFENTNGTYQIKGVDFLIQKKFKSLRSWLGYSWSQNNYLFPTLNNATSFPNNIDVQHTITFNNSYTWKNASIAIGTNWHTGIPTTTGSIDPSSDIENAQILFNPPNNERLENFFRTDVSFNYKLNFGSGTKARIGLSIWNILNQKQTILSYYSSVNNTPLQLEKESLGITPNISFRLFF